MLDALVLHKVEEIRERNRKAGAPYGNINWTGVRRSDAVKARLMAGHKTYNKYKPRVH